MAGVARHLIPSITIPGTVRAPDRVLAPFGAGEPEQAELARRQIEQGHTFREQVEQYREACEQSPDAQLEGYLAASKEAAEKSLEQLKQRTTELVARGEQQIACMRREGEKLLPAPVPPSLRAALAAYAG